MEKFPLNIKNGLNLNHLLKDVSVFHWITNIEELSILNVKHLTMERLRDEDMRTYQKFIEKELGNDGIFEKLLFLIVTMYFVATEMRLKEGNDNG